MSDRAGHMLLLAAGSARTLRSFAGCPGPHHVAVLSSRAAVAARSANGTLAVFDAASGRVRSLPVDRGPHTTWRSCRCREGRARRPAGPSSVPPPVPISRARRDRREGSARSRHERTRGRLAVGADRPGQLLRRPLLRRRLPRLHSIGLPRRYRDASPVSHVDRGDPPFLLANGSADIVPLVQAQRMARRLRAAHVAHELIVVAGSRHPGEYATQVWRSTVRFLTRQLRP